MTRDEIVEAVRMLDSGKLSETNDHELIVKLSDALPHSGISDLIYYSEPELGPEEIADEALRREELWKAQNNSPSG